MALKVFISKKNGDDTVTIDHDEFRHIIVFEGCLPIYMNTFYKGVHNAVALNANEMIVDLEQQETSLKKNWDFI